MNKKVLIGVFLLALWSCVNNETSSSPINSLSNSKESIGLSNTLTSTTISLENSDSSVSIDSDTNESTSTNSNENSLSSSSSNGGLIVDGGNTESGWGSIMDPNK